MSSQALILVDLQKEWTDPNSEYYISDLKGFVKNINKLIDFFRKQNSRIIFIRHIEESGIAFREKNTQIIKSVNKEPADAEIIKHRIDSFYKTNLKDILTGIKEVVIGGILTNLCVRSLIEGAYDRDFKITVIKDCCITYDEKTQDFTFADLKNTRDEIRFTNLKNFTK
jgi:biuret amidohydrolase